MFGSQNVSRCCSRCWINHCDCITCCEPSVVGASVVVVVWLSLFQVLGIKLLLFKTSVVGIGASVVVVAVVVVRHHVVVYCWSWCCWWNCCCCAAVVVGASCCW